MRSVRLTVLTTTSEYAIRAIGYLAMGDLNVRIGSDEIAEMTGVPKRFLLKILNMLKNQGIVQANRGIGGGFRLAKPPETISLYDIVSIFEDPTRHEHCLLGEPVCVEKSDCPVHERWKDLQVRYEHFLKDIDFSKFRGSSAFQYQKSLIKQKV